MTKPGRCLYFIRQGRDGPIRIGETTFRSLGRRMNHLQVGNPEKLHLMGAFPAHWLSETIVHADLREHLIRGEWFAPHTDVLAKYEELAERDRPSLVPDLIEITA